MLWGDFFEQAPKNSVLVARVGSARIVPGRWGASLALDVQGRLFVDRGTSQDFRGTLWIGLTSLGGLNAFVELVAGALRRWTPPQGVAVTPDELLRADAPLEPVLALLQGTTAAFVVTRRRSGNGWTVVGVVPYDKQEWTTAVVRWLTGLPAPLPKPAVGVQDLGLGDSGAPGAPVSGPAEGSGGTPEFLV